MSTEIGLIDGAMESGPTSNLHATHAHATHADDSDNEMQHRMHHGASDDTGHEDHTTQSTLCEVACAGVAVTFFALLEFEFSALPAGKWRIPYSLKPERSGGAPLLQPPRV